MFGGVAGRKCGHPLCLIQVTMKIRSKAVWGAWMALTLALATPGRAQTPDPGQTPPPAQTPPVQTTPAAPVASNPDVRLDPLQPDFTLAALPTTLRLPAHKLSFRVTHRFTRSFGSGSVGDLLNDFFGFDSAALIGLELRYGLMPGTQVGIHRTSDKTIQFFGQQSIWTEKPDGHPLGIDFIAAIEGLNNFREVEAFDGTSAARHQNSGSFGLLVSRKAGKVAALYAEPIFVVNSSPLQTGDNNTMMIGLGTRLRIRPATYLVGEITPRLSGYRPGVSQMSFGLEGRAGGHTFQVNFSNGFGTTLGQLARGGVDYSSWFIGFNISRKFF
jgi:uncharacterized beta barrel domain-containing protein DUF5777